MTEFQQRYCEARRRVIAREYAHLNPPQREGVLTTEGPLLLLAGAGSGKTTVLIHRVANLLTYGRGSDSHCTELPDGVGEDELEYLEQYPPQPTEEDRYLARSLCAIEPAKPWEVLAITFTNKAAGELKQRLSRMLGEEQAQQIWAATFHSACVRILRRDIHRIGYSDNFTIYDTDDSKRVIREICKELGLEEKTFPPREVLSIISNCKNNLQSAQELKEQAEATNNWRMSRIAGVFIRYDQRLKEANALDFDDIILHTVQLLQQEREVREYYQRKFRYVLIDEYQDTNRMQYVLSTLLAGGRQNICVVGDDDQSIYRFRGADIENILSFEKKYPGARVIRLEQNYRSTQNILDAANAVIRNNQGRKGKTLWTENGSGDKVKIRTCLNESDEAQFVVGDILESVGRGVSWKEHAILYRVNAQSNALEYAFKRNGVPYQIIGGTRFFDRAEVKDMLSYLCVIHNPADDLRLMRVINTPARGIGDATIEAVQQIAAETRQSMYQVLCHASDYPRLRQKQSRLLEFAQMLQELIALSERLPLSEFYREVCVKSGYIAALQAKDTLENRGRVENVEELGSSIQSFLDTQPEDPTLSGFLNEIALYSDLDEEKSEDCVVMMTMHSAKGLEFPCVYVVGMEENLFPSLRSIGEQEELEEERRLCYVAMTRAKSRLVLTNTRQRLLFGRTTPNLPSRFLSEIPEENRIWQGRPESGYDPEERENYGYRDFSPFAEERDVAKMIRRPIHSTPQHAAYNPPAAAPLLQLQQGEMVEHKTFGRGMVLSVQKMGNDALAEVAFDQVGTKKLMLRTAGAHMKKL